MNQQHTSILANLSSINDYPLSRRVFLKRGIGLALSIPVVSALLAGCEDADDDVADSDSDGAIAEDDDSEGAAEDEPVDAPDDTVDDEAPEVSSGGTVRFVMPELATDPTTMSPLFTQGGGDQSAIM